jgi:antitoxin HicB
MVRTAYSYPATLEPDEDGRLVVHFADLPEALTDGADEAEALREAADCLSEALASRIVDGEAIPTPAALAPGQHLVSPDPTIALKAALYTALRHRDMTVADLADRLGVADWHQAARLIDPRRSSKLTSLAAALSAVGCRIAIAIEETRDFGDSARDHIVGLFDNLARSAEVKGPLAHSAFEVDPSVNKD